ncbi:MAG: M15 family metallopeptidase [Corallincola sp.]|nr:M15 family metallopeptidase [Corallincola sp.]
MSLVLTPEQLTGQADDHLVRWSADAANPRLHPAAADALRAMATAAAADGLHLAIASGFRDYQRQALIWNGKWDGSRPLADGPRPQDEQQRLHAILRWSALPGSSRHHWGSDLDLFASNLLPTGTSLQLEPWEYQPGGHQHPLWQWLQRHAAEFGFFWPYDRERGGVAAEPWHLSFGDIARPALAALTPACVAAALLRQPLLGQTTILQALPELLTRYCYNINPEGR